MIEQVQKVNGDDCPDCSGTIEAQITGVYRNLVCEECGLIVGTDNLRVEHEEQGEEPEWEIEEL